jgi:hypothetical protein
MTAPIKKPEAAKKKGVHSLLDLAEIKATIVIRDKHGNIKHKLKAKRIKDGS